ncbi:MAG: 5-dehydro-2-deoxygluconokinase [Sulfobacillus sp.]|nr:5-dehydro-2-deoxygluconokinase [Sulfobacillus sp.]
MTAPAIFVFGRVIVDLYANELHRALEEVHSFSKYLGGSAGNMAVGLARLGASVGLISRVGRDPFGNFLKHQLTVEGVDITQVTEDPCHETSAAFAALFPPDDSSVFFYGKHPAYRYIAIRDIDQSILMQAPILLVVGTALAASPSRDAVLWALDVHRQAGGTNVMDIDWRSGFWDDLTTAQFYYRKALEMTDIVLANAPELALIGQSDDIEQGARVLAQYGVTEVVAKRGSEGAWYVGPEGVLHQPAYPVVVMNTLGAGDGFGAAYVYGLTQQWSAVDRLQFASAAAAIVVSRHSCSEAMPRREEIEQLLRQQSNPQREV